MAFFVRILALLSVLQQVSCWGSLGHRTVAYLAEKYLTNQGAQYLSNLLDGEDISEASLWPDKIKHSHGWTYTSGWHYIDAQDDPPRTCGVKYRRDCIPKTGCVVSAIVNMTSQIIDSSSTPEDQLNALKFLLHFIGDIHQPLHTEHESRGGNEIHVLFNQKHTNLHSIWDTEMLEKHAGGPKNDEKEDALRWADSLFTAMSEKGNANVAECDDVQNAEGCALLWAGEANQYICTYVLKNDIAGVEGRNLAGKYYDGAVPIIDHLVGKAGARLGGWINAIAAAKSATSSETLPLMVQGENKVHQDIWDL